MPTQGKAQINVSYILPSNIQAKNYQLLIQKQPGTQNQKLKVEVDGRNIYNDVLDVDHEFKVK